MEQQLGMPASSATRRALLRRGGGLAAASALFGARDLSRASGALAAPAYPDLGRRIEGWASYDGQDLCSPTEKPGVAAFRSLVLRQYPSTGDYGITRACNIGGRSEHKEGRAWDWRVSAYSQLSTARDLLYWLLATDQYGNWHAMARRLGVMYVIFNRRIWCAYRDPERWHSYTGPNPHTDHVHFSFSWAGARRQTSYWTGSVATVVAADTSAMAGAVLVTSEGGVTTVGEASFHGSLAEAPPADEVVDVAAPVMGGGYLLATADGAVHSFGGTRYRGDAKALPLDQPISGIAAPNPSGYWLVGRDGGVFSYGDAPSYGSLPERGLTAPAPVIGIAPTASGKGYWLTAENGEVFAFGDAQLHGSAAGQVSKPVVGLSPTPSGRGYWMVTADGDVKTFGDAAAHGTLAGRPLPEPVTGLSPTPSGQGYQLVTADGGIYPFGDAVEPGSEMPDH